MYPVHLPETRDERDDYVDEYPSPKWSMWPLAALLILVAIVLVSVALWG